MGICRPSNGGPINAGVLWARGGICCSLTVLAGVLLLLTSHLYLAPTGGSKTNLRPPAPQPVSAQRALLSFLTQTPWLVSRKRAQLGQAGIAAFPQREASPLYEGAPSGNDPWETYEISAPSTSAWVQLCGLRCLGHTRTRTPLFDGYTAVLEFSRCRNNGSSTLSGTYASKTALAAETAAAASKPPVTASETAVTASETAIALSETAVTASETAVTLSETANARDEPPAEAGPRAVVLAAAAAAAAAAASEAAKEEAAFALGMVQMEIRFTREHVESGRRMCCGDTTLQVNDWVPPAGSLEAGASIVLYELHHSGAEKRMMCADLAPELTL